jgi:hypothetical protein
MGHGDRNRAGFGALEEPAFAPAVMTAEVRLAR